MKRKDIDRFINEIKSPQKLISGCKKFHELEPRDVAYVISWRIAHEQTGSMAHLLAGSKLIIITWNVVRFLRRPKEIRAGLENDMIGAYNECRFKLDNLSLMKLENLDFHSFKRAIEHIFSTFSSKRSIEFTGASKVLHVINPNVFMMWDSSIRNAYHKLHEDKNHGIAECYTEFLQQSQEIIQAILNKTTEDKLWEEHLTFIDRDFVQALSFNETVLKMLDECNYIKIKQEIDF